MLFRALALLCLSALPALAEPICDPDRGTALSVTGVASAGSKGERGIADVWWRGKFGWEYKRKG